MPAIPRHLLSRLVAEALLEDLGPGDITTCSVIPESAMGRAEIVTRKAIVAAGTDAAILAFRSTDPSARIAARVKDGESVGSGGLILAVEGKARALLEAERTALNFLARLSGIATLTGRFVEAAGRSGSAIADTRKTTPGWRLLEKAAVRSGGGDNHRFGLYDAVLIKDNHVAMAGGVRQAVLRAREALGAAIDVEVEVRNQGEVAEALEAGASWILLDNFAPEEIPSAVAKAKGRARVEISGGVTLENVGALARMGADRISVGALTHSAGAADLTMRCIPWAK